MDRGGGGTTINTETNVKTGSPGPFSRRLFFSLEAFAFMEKTLFFLFLLSNVFFTL